MLGGKDYLAFRAFNDWGFRVQLWHLGFRASGSGFRGVGFRF